MPKKTVILGIESSCDETAAALVTDQGDLPKILSNVVSSQVEVHKSWGGVVPELAARAHLEKIDIITKKALEKSKLKLLDIDAIAVTAGPGLVVCLSVGLSFAKSLSITLKKPLIAVNHLEGHAFSPKFVSKISFPYLLLLISGGHTQYLSVNGLGNYKRLGTTIDDALGEAYDKTAKLLGVGFPGGPEIEKLAKFGNEKRFVLPKPIINKGGCNLSFAGLKTAILRLKKQIKTKQDKFDMAASFQKTIEEILYKKTKVAFKEFKRERRSLSTFVVAGGVASNKCLRKMFLKISKEEKVKILFPPFELCCDNAAMIALVGLEKYKKKKFDKLDYPVKPRWSLDENAKFLKGAGVKL